jgi:hypothetical protein
MPIAAPLPAPDYDSLVLRRASRVLAAGSQDAVTHLVFTLSQRTAGSEGVAPLIRVVRLGVPSAAAFTADQSPVDAQRDLLLAMRHQGLTFLSIVAQLPGPETLFACGTQGVGATVEKATAQADGAWDILSNQMLGVHNRFLVPLSVAKMDSLVAAQESWGHVSMVRGCAGANAPLSGATALETFLRGTTQEFVLTLIAEPLEFGFLVLARDIARQDAEFGVMGFHLETQLERCAEGLEYGAFLYQAFLLCPTEGALEATSDEINGAYFDAEAPHPLHVERSRGENEPRRLRTHAATFTCDRKPADDPHTVERFAFSTYVTLRELACLAHPVG